MMLMPKKITNLVRKYWPIIIILQSLLAVFGLYLGKFAPKEFVVLISSCYVIAVIFFAYIQAVNEHNKKQDIEAEIEERLSQKHYECNMDYLTELFQLVRNFMDISFKTYKINVFMYTEKYNTNLLCRNQRFITGTLTRGEGLMEFDPENSKELTISQAYLDNTRIFTDLESGHPVYNKEIEPQVDKSLKWVLAKSLKNKDGRAIGVICFNSLQKKPTTKDLQLFEVIIDSLARAVSDILIFRNKMIREAKE